LALKGCHQTAGRERLTGRAFTSLTTLAPSDGNSDLYLWIFLPEKGKKGFDEKEITVAHPRTKNIPILINTGAVLNEEERQWLAGNVQSITSKTERENPLAELERLDASSEEAVGNGANL
jgi:hypothetical protein